MSITTGAPAPTGPRLVEAFLEELAERIEREAGRTISGFPGEIVQAVVRHNERFAGCSQKSLNDLSRQLVMAINAKGWQFNLIHRPLREGGVEVTFA